MKRLTTALKRLRSYFSSPLALGMTDYAEWSDSVAELIGPIADKDSLQFCIASEVIRLGPDVTASPKNYFVKRVKAGAAKQIAGAVFTEIKTRQQDAQRAAIEAAKTAAEVTVAPPEATVGTPQAQS
jgi:hypothetical protein